MGCGDCQSDLRIRLRRGGFFDCAIEDISERKRVEAALRKRADELASLHAISLEITAAHALPDLLDIIVRQAARLLEAPGGNLALCEPDKGVVRICASIDPLACPAGTILNYGEGALGTVAKTGEPLIIADYHTWPGRILSEEGNSSRDAVLSVPLIWQGKVLGVLQVQDDSRTRCFTETDQDLLTLLANQAAIAVENARLLETERSQLLLTRTLQEVGALLTSELRLEIVLESILDLLARVVKYDSASIQLVDDQGRFRLSAGRGFSDIEQARQNVCDLSNVLLARDLHARKIIVVPDTTSYSEWVVVPGGEKIKSWIGAALMVKGRFIGILNVDSHSLNAYDQDIGETVLAFANQAAIAIENARLFETEEKRVTQLESLRQASLSLTASLDLQAVLNAILESVIRLLPGVNNGHIFLYYPEGGGRLVFGAALWSDGRQGEPIAEPRSDGLTYNVARSGEAILVPDMRSHPLFQGVPEWWQGSIIGLPLKIGARVVGVMNVSHTQPGAFTDASLSMLRLLGDQAAIAIENARLFEQAATERRHLGLLYDMGRELAPSLEVDEILKRALTLTAEALGGSCGKAFLFLPELSQLSLRSTYGYLPEQANFLQKQLALKPGAGLEGWVMQNRQAVIIPDITQDARWLSLPEIDERTRSALAAPILHRDRILGVIALSSRQPVAFNEDHLKLLQAICQQVGLALTNVGRYQEVQRLVDLLAAEQQRLESLVERLPVGVLVLDDDYRLMVVNSLGREILEALEGCRVGQRLARLGPLSLDQLTARYEDPIPAEINMPGPPNRIFEVQMRSLVGEQAQWVIMVRDITQERQNQVRIQMQERLATVGQLAAGIAHDFNNIMAAILVYTDLLKRDLNHYPAARDRLSVIQQQVQRASSLIRQILDFSRRSVMEQSSLDLLPFIKELDKLLARVLPETIQLDLTYQPGVYLVNADPTRLQQVFMNMAVNARDAMPDGGLLRFELDRLQLGPEDTPPAPYLPPGDWIVITIADTGTGIPEEAMPHIFEPFFTTKAVGQGTGLGLAQAYGIIKQHDGYIDLQSRVGEGTKFIIYLPALTEPEIEPPSEPEVHEFNGSGETILVVEDDEVTRIAMKELLEAQQYQVLTASNGIEALSTYEQQPDEIALVISDVVMPEMGGVALYRSLRERWSQVKMLFVTGHPLDDENQSLLEESQVYWLQKPFSVPDFSQAIQILLAD